MGAAAVAVAVGGGVPVADRTSGDVVAAAVGLGEDCDTGEAVLAGLLNNSGVDDAAAAGLSCFLLSRLVAMEESNLARIASSSSSSSSSSASTTAFEDSFRCLLMWMLFFLAVKELFDLLLSEVFRFRRPPDLLLLLSLIHI